MQKMRNDFVATGFVINQSQTKVLLIFHKKLQKWLPAGGHLDPNELPHDGALREVFEETGVRAELISTSIDLKITTSKDEQQAPTPYCILYERIPANKKEEEHMHFDFVYLMQANEVPINKADLEIEDAGWFTLPEVLALNTFDGVRKICSNILDGNSAKRSMDKK